MEQIGNLGFWLGLLLALPIGIVTNLLTPRIQARWAKRSRRVAADREREQREQAALIIRYRRNQAAYWSYLYLSLSRILLRVAVLLGTVIIPFLINDPLWSLSTNVVGVLAFGINVAFLILAVGTFAALLNDVRRTRIVVTAIAVRDEDDDPRTESQPQS
ncbi:hypothetical protein [Nonomuraea ceibae]|uniref:hypothetical protein n=1 Tax=Nonomuraea ceibae TaxID=1935170 RepID=UPI001C5FBE1A|nr:hypothetical protein [Nonomuraea ceibae]